MPSTTSINGVLFILGYPWYNLRTRVQKKAKQRRLTWLLFSFLMLNLNSFCFEDAKMRKLCFILCNHPLNESLSSHLSVNSAPVPFCCWVPHKLPSQPRAHTTDLLSHVCPTTQRNVLEWLHWFAICLSKTIISTICWYSITQAYSYINQKLQWSTNS